VSTAPDRVYGYAAIAAVLSELWGAPVSEDGAYRMSTRSTTPLPVDGYQGRVWASRERIGAWVAEERRRRGRAPTSEDSRQGDLFEEVRKAR
jgi:hypothetical protein